MRLVAPEALLADKGNDAYHFVESSTAHSIKVIPPKSNRRIKRDCDFVLYCERNLVERFYIIKHSRAIGTATRRPREIFSRFARWFGLNDDAPDLQ